MEKKSDSFDLYLIIGLTKESRHWSEDFLNEIRSQLKPNKIHLVDLPGSGKFLHSKSPTTLASIVDQTREQLEFESDRKKVVVAISLGGMVAWEWVTRYPHDFDAMVMINSSMAGVSSVFKRVQPKAILSFIQIALANKGEMKEKLILDLCSNHESNAKKIHPIWAKIGVEGDMRFSNVLRQLVAGMRFRPKAIPQLPLLLIASNTTVLHIIPVRRISPSSLRLGWYCVMTKALGMLFTWMALSFWSVRFQAGLKAFRCK